jgi:hypothetical protein
LTLVLSERDVSDFIDMKDIVAATSLVYDEAAESETTPSFQSTWPCSAL